MDEVLAKRRRSAAKGRFHRICRRFNNSLHEASPMSVLKEILTDLESSYKELDERTTEFLELLDDDIDNDKINELQTDMDSIYKELCDIKSLLSRKTEEKHSENKKSVFQTMKVKKLDTPAFSGKIRDYPSFKRDYERHMIPTYGEDPFALKKCLSGEALSCVKGVDDDFTEMFRRLDLKYGRPEKLSDAVLVEIKALKPVKEGDLTGLVAMIDVVENCWLDLRKMGLEGEMGTSTMVSQIERLLPSVQKREWALKRQRTSASSPGGSFRVFLDFLLEEKQAIEYIENDMRETKHIHQHGKVHSSTADGTQCNNTNPNLQDQLERQGQMLEQVVQGLAQVAQVLTDNKLRDSQRKSGIQRACWYHGTDNHNIEKCTGFGQLSAKEKLECVRKNGGCFSCLKQGHISNRCLNHDKCGVEGCTQSHHPLLHQSFSPINGMSFHNAANSLNGNRARTGDTLLMVSRVKSHHASLTVLWDPGANMSLITHASARRLGLTGKKITLSVTKVGNVTEVVPSREYTVPLVDTQGRVWTIQAYGMDEVTADVGDVDVSKVVSLFNEISENDMKRPTGKVDILIGSDCCVILPEKVQEVGNLQLMKNQFGYCLRGRHDLLSPTKNECNLVYIHFASGCVSCPTSDELVIKGNHSIQKDLQKFFELESLGTQCVPKCGGCRCGKCPPGGKDYTLREERELALIQSGLVYNPEDKRWTASYPWIRDPITLPNNYDAAKSRMLSTERRLIRAGTDYAKLYDDQIRDMVKRKVARMLSEKEINEHNGPVHYLPHHEVLKPASKSTPLRIVFNSSASFMGHTLNDYWAKGPNIVNDLMTVLLRFREGQIGMTGDISKMYNSVKISKADQHTHRFLWRNLDERKEPDHYVMEAVTFGDRPSGAIASLALLKTAELAKDSHEKVANIIKDNSYVDDILCSTDSISDAETISKDIDVVLERGGFKVKHWTLSGMTTEAENSDAVDPQEKVLGMIWDPKTDTFRYKAKLNFSPKTKKIHEEQNLCKEDIPDQIPQCLTHRMVLSQVSRIFDPLRLITPFILRAKSLMRSLCKRDTVDQTGEGKTWDSAMDEVMRKEWIKFFSDLFVVETLKFPRCIKPVCANGDPILIVFSDGSKDAFGACAYIRWKTRDGIVSTNLVAAKNRIAPTRQLSIPRLELCGAVLGVRLREKLVNGMKHCFERVFHVVDSMIVRAQIQKESYGFGTFTATRVAEIQSKSSPDEWWWVSGNNNVADLTTRITDPKELNRESVWQTGPSFLTMPLKDWPISQSCDMEENLLPDTVGHISVGEIKIIEEICQADKISLEDVNLKHFKNTRTLFRVTALLMRITKNRSFKQKTDQITSHEIKEAERMWVKHAQADIRPDWKTAYQRLGVLRNPDGFLVVGSRMSEWMKATWNQTEFILLPPKTEFTKLLLRTHHNKDHTGIETTLAKLRSKYWVPGARNILKWIRKQCVTCRRKEKIRQTQVMGTLPLDRTKPSPAFSSTAVDLFGPFTIRDTVKRRTHGKAYGVIFTCLASRGVHLDLTDSYNTDGFMMVLRRFVALRGYPKKLRSDCGSQLVAASKNVAEIELNWQQIKTYGVDEGLEWEFNKSADSPWENGCCESLIRSVKKCLTSAVGDNVMSFAELQTVLFEVANTLNERPIGTKNSDPNDGSYLCPNDLLLGRASTKVPPGTWSDKECFKFRWKFIQQVVDSFWKRWIRDFFPTLIIRQKWHTSSRNLLVGDIVLVQDSNAVRGQWKLAQVCEAIPGKDGKVRDVELRYKPQEPGKGYRGIKDITVRRSVHRLVLILPIEEQS